MRTKKVIRFDEQSDREIEKVILKFTQRLMSNSKWIRLVDHLVENAGKISKIEFKKVQRDQIGELFINENTTFEFDYWKNGFEGCNSLGGWLTFKEIEYLIFPRIVDKHKQVEQDLKIIEALVNSVGHFDLEVDDNRIKLNCYKE